MSKWFHVTMTQGRADSFELESTSKGKLLTFLNTVSTAVVSSIKEIVFSKEKNINYNSTIQISNEKAYRKVEVFCKSENYAKLFTLYHVPLSVTKELLVKEFKKLLILDEPIIDIYNVLFFEDVEGVARPSDNNYQLLYKVNSRSHHIELEATDFTIVKDFFENVLQRDLYEIRHHVHNDDSLKLDNADYVSYKSCYVKGLNGAINSFKVPKIKRTISNNQFEQLVYENVNVNGQKIKSIRVTTKF